jgi:DNA-binding MarR family transcriptional regulator
MRRPKIKDPGQVPLGLEEWAQAEGKLEADAGSSAPREANQQKDVDEEELGKAATTVFSWLYGIARSACRKGKIEPEHLPTLEALEKHPQANLTDLGKKVGVHPTTVKRQMDVLQKNGVGAVRPGCVKKKKAMIAEIIPAGRAELSCCRSRIASELKGGLDRRRCESEDFANALERLLAASKATPR